MQSREALAQCPGIDFTAAEYLVTIRQVILHALRRDLPNGPVLADASSLIAYLHVGLAHATEEEFRVLFLNVQNRLLGEEVINRGSAREVQAYPRTIVKRAFELGATALILVHNHPSGEPEPSATDIQTTKRIVSAAAELEIVVHDHLVIARSGWASFRNLGLL